MPDQQPINGHRIDRIERALEQVISVQATHQEALVRLTAVVDHLAEVQHTHAEETDRRFRETDGRFRETDELFRELRERFRETDERLNSLIEIVDDIIRRRPPEKPPA